MENKQPGILTILLQDEFYSAAAISRQLGISEKTVRKRIKELNDILRPNGADIISKARFGYKLTILDEKAFRNFLLKEEEERKKIPETPEERSLYLLAYLINRYAYVKMDDLCDFLYVSKTTMSQTMKAVENILNRYQIMILRKPNYGIKIAGQEFDIRRLICDYFVKRNALSDLPQSKQEEDINELARLIWRLLVKYDIHLAEIAFENFVEYVYVAMKRMSCGFYLRDDYKHLQTGIVEKSFADELILILKDKYDIEYNSYEKNYLLLYLEGRHLIPASDFNFVIKEKMDSLVLQMLDLLYREYHIDFRNNFDLRMSLNQHIVPFDIRMKYGIPLKNPVLEETKEKYCLAFEMSLKVSTILGEHYKKDIPEDETAYFAMIFALALEKNRPNIKSNIVIVSNTGSGSSKLLKYKYENTFSDYINQIYTCDLIDLESFNYAKADYIFTTIPLTREVPVPVMEIGIFLEDSDIRQVTDILKKGRCNGMDTYYTKDRFITDIKAETKEEILRELCTIIEKNEAVDANFFDLVIERESYMYMDYGNYIAIPHPSQIASEVTFAYVTVLKKPVLWNRVLVQVIILTSIGRKEDSNRQNFYEATARFTLNAAAIKKLISSPNYETLMQVLE